MDEFCYTYVACLPSHWCSMSDDSVCHFEVLDTKSKEYNEVKTQFEASMPPPTSGKRSTDDWHKIVKIERIQNPLLYSQYMGKKKAMDSHNPKGYQNERKLFHGCPEDVTEKISYRGFNRSFAGKNGMYIRVCTCTCEWILGKHAYFTHPILLIS